MSQNRRSSGLVHCFDILKGMVDDPVVMETLKRLESFKQECETFGIYDERKSLQEMRADLEFAKASGTRGYIQ